MIRPQEDASQPGKKSLVRDMWIGGGMLMLAVGETAGIVALALAFTFVSFMILDETV